MRIPILLICFLACSQTLLAQKSLTGLWTGVTTNDSITGRKDESFEIALTQYKEKVYGYTRRTFIVNDTLYYALKRVKGRVNGTEAEVTEDEYISYNFAGRAAKGVKVTYTFQLNQQDSTWHLDGRWQTNEVKRRGYYGMGGTVTLKEKSDFNNSELFQQLDDLKLDKEVEFYAKSKTPVKVAEPEQQTARPAKVEVEKTKQKDKEEKQKEELAKTPKEKEKNKQKEKNKKVEEEQATVRNTKEKNKQKEESKPSDKIKTQEEQAIAKTTKENKKAEQEQALTKATATENKTETQAPVIANKKPETPVAAPIAKTTIERIKERVNLPPQLVSFKSDSLQLALYDNGEVDGDTVSVLLNGQVILEKQGLKTIAIKKTIQVPPGQDELTLVLFAENLGKYPPNTGLLVVRDGEDVYQLRFSADLSQNATIIFRRQQ